MNPSKPKSNLDRRLLQESKAAAPLLLANIGFTIIASFLLIGQALLLSQIINRAYLENLPLEALGSEFSLLLGILALRAIAAYFSSITAASLALRVKAALQARFIAQVYHLGVSFTQNERSGELVLLASSAIEKLDAYYREYLPSIFIAVILPLLILLIVLPLDALTFFVLLVTAPLIPFLMALIGMAAGKVAQKQFSLLRFLSAHFLDVMQGLTTLKLFNRSQYQVSSIQRINEEFRQATMHVLRIAFLSAFSLEMLATLSVAIVAVEIGLRLLHGGIVFEQALFLLIIAPEFYLPLRMLGAKFHNATESKAAAERLFEILDRPVLIQDKTQNTEKLNFAAIHFEKLSFAYEEDQEILNQLNFTIPLGKIVAIVGKSGSGKTSIAQLLLGFIRPSSGRILLGDRDLLEIPLEQWRENLAWLSQSPYLFNTTIAENIRLSKPEAGESEVLAAAQLAGADEFIQRLADGYETLVGENGLRLSGGQRQRIALARALLRNAPLLILDEASSQLDSKTEAEIIRRIFATKGEQTILLLAHRLQTVAHADWIIVLDKGQIVEQGHPKDLLEHDSHYAKLLRSDEAEYA